MPGIEAMDMVRKGRVRWIAKGDPVGQTKFIGNLFAAQSTITTHYTFFAPDHFHNETILFHEA